MDFAFAAAFALACVDPGLALAPPPAGGPGAAPIVIAEAASVAAQHDLEVAPSPTSLVATDAPDGPLAFAGVSDADVVERVLGALDAVTTLEGDFTQIAPSGAISTGKFFLDRPGQLRFEYAPPTPLLIVATGGTVFVRDDALDTTDSYRVNQTPLKFLLRKKVDLGDAKLINVDRGVDNLAVTFGSSDEETEGDITLVFSAPALALRQWAVRDAQEGTTVVALENVIAGSDIPNRLFAVPESGSPFLKN